MCDLDGDDELDDVLNVDELNVDERNSARRTLGLLLVIIRTSPPRHESAKGRTAKTTTTQREDHIQIDVGKARMVFVWETSNVRT